MRFRFTFWRNGQASNPGIQEVAELGSGGAFMDEVAGCGDACSDGEGFMCTPMSGVCQAQGQITMTPARPYLSTATMVAPSPDWCAFSFLRRQVYVPAKWHTCCHRRHATRSHPSFCGSFGPVDIWIRGLSVMLKVLCVNSKTLLHVNSKNVVATGSSSTQSV